MRFQRIVAVFLFFLPISGWAQNNVPHLYLFNQAVSPFSSSVAEAGLLSGKNYDPFVMGMSIRRDSGEGSLRIGAGVTLPTGSNTRINFSVGKILKNKLLISFGYGGQNLNYKESATSQDEPNGIKSRAFAANFVYKLKMLTFQAGGTYYSFDQDKTIKETGFYSSLGATYSISDFQIGLQLRGMPFGKGGQTIQYTEIENGQEISRKEDNSIHLPTQIVIPASYTIVHNEKLSAFIEGNAGYLLANLPTNSNKLNLGGMVRLNYKPFFLQAGYAASGFTGGNFSEKIGVGAGIQLKDLSVIYSYSTNQVYNSLQLHSLGVAIILGQ